MIFRLIDGDVWNGSNSDTSNYDTPDVIHGFSFINAGVGMLYNIGRPFKFHLCFWRGQSL